MHLDILGTRKKEGTVVFNSPRRITWQISL